MRSSLASETTLISIIPDGTVVEKGTVLAELDNSTLKQALAKQQVSVMQAHRTLQDAEAQLEEARSTVEQGIPLAELQVRVAELAKSRYLDEGGELDCQSQKIERTVTARQARYLKVENEILRSKLLTAADHSERPFCTSTLFPAQQANIGRCTTWSTIYVVKTTSPLCSTMPLKKDSEMIFRVTVVE